MAPIPQERSHGPVAREVGSMVLAHVAAAGPAALARAAGWHDALSRLGLHLPLFFVHDLGHLLAAGRSGVALGPRPELARAELDEAWRAPLRQYQELLADIAGSETATEASSWRMRDDLLAMVLARVVRDLYERWPDRTKDLGAAALPREPALYAGADLLRHFHDFDRAPLLAFLRHVAAQRLHLCTSVERVDLDTVRLLGLFYDEERAGAAVDLPELVQTLSLPQASDVVRFSLDLLPSVLETKRQSGAQTFGVDGYASIERHGTVDSVVLSELGLDQDLFERKVVDGELYYYGHERQREEERRLQLLLVDASAAMRGVREVFARGLALTLVKKLALAGDEITVRFFDSRLYEPLRVGPGGGFRVPALLCFRSERGRNYAKVFQQVLAETERLRRERRRPVVIYLLTHGECHIPVELVARLRRVATLYGVFILPSRPLALEYLGELHRHQVVSAGALASRSGRADRAREIVQDASGERRRWRRA